MTLELGADHLTFDKGNGLFGLGKNFFPGIQWCEIFFFSVTGHAIFFSGWVFLSLQEFFSLEINLRDIFF